MAAVAAAYQTLALLAALSRWGWRKPALRSDALQNLPPVSVLKPVRGADPGFYEAIRSNAAQDYPHFEVLIGVSHPNDAAIPVIERVIREFPERSIRSIGGLPSTPNGKAGKLTQLAAEAHGAVLVISDGDIWVPPGYLERVVAPLADPRIGLVTCAYRARAETWPARFEALGVATDFGPSTMVAPFVGIDEFGLGSTLVVRAKDLERIGGFAALSDYLADDYQLGCRIHSLGLRCVLSDVIVETHLPGNSWGEVWRHQVRWARTIRVSRAGGYAGLPIANATVWALVAAVAGRWPIALGLLSVRYLMAFVAGWLVLRSADTLRLWWLIPIRDLWGMAVWAAGLFGDTVEWGGERLHLTPDGRIVR